MKTKIQKQAAKIRRQNRLILRLRERIWRQVRVATYVCQHNFSAAAPVGTRLDAIEDLRRNTNESIDFLHDTE